MIKATVVYSRKGSREARVTFEGAEMFVHFQIGRFIYINQPVNVQVVSLETIGVPAGEKE